MKVKFNLPSKRFTNNFSFDNNTTLGIGNVQPLFCKSIVAGSKLSIGYSQLTRLAPLVVPTFAMCAPLVVTVRLPKRAAVKVCYDLSGVS